MDVSLGIWNAPLNSKALISQKSHDTSPPIPENEPMGVHYQPPSSTSIYIDNTASALIHRESRGDLGLGVAQSAECPEGWLVGSKRQDNLSF